MKLVTNDYGCGTSSSIFDYGIEDVIIVSEDNYDHVFEADDDLLFIGHDFLMYLWDSDEKIERWKSHKHGKAVWCFERIDAIVPQWKSKSHYSMFQLKKFTEEIYACDEDDCDKYGYKWLPQWASKRFYDLRDNVIENENILFSGQAGKKEYSYRNLLLKDIISDDILCNKLILSNTSRSLSWDDYVINLLKYRFILNPVGIIKALNVRAYEALYSGRILLQHAVGEYKRHENMLKDFNNVIFFRSFLELKEIMVKIDKENYKIDTTMAYNENNIYTRMKSIGYEIK